MAALKITLKGHCDTRWSSKKRAITALCTHINDIYVLLQNFSNDSSNNYETISGAKILLEQINVKFLCLLHVWKDILVNVDKVNCSLQLKNISINCANIMLKGLLTIMKQMRDTGIKNYVKISMNLAVEFEIEPNFPEKRKKKKKRMTSELAEDEGHLLTSVEELEIELNAVFDSIIVQLNWRYDRMTDIVSDFEFLSGFFLYNQLDDQIKKCAADLAIKYSNDFNGPELCLEIVYFKNQCKSYFPNLKVATPLDLLNMIHAESIKDVYPNVEIALRIYLTLPVTVASCERSFSKLKLIKNYLRSSLKQERLTNLSILSIEQVMANNIDYEDIINDFASVKARKHQFI